MIKLRIYFSVFLTLFLFSQFYPQNNISELNLMPYPKSINLEEGKFRIDENFNVKFTNVGHRIEKLSDRFLKRLADRTGLFLKNPFAKELDNSIEPSLKIEIEKESKLVLNEDESYNLKISENKIELNSSTDLGAIRGVETLLQLLESDSLGYYFSEVVIKDEPRFPWRGLMIDVCRHFMPIEVIKRNIDGMAAVKLNVLHLHLSEDQGFRIESKIFPKLTELGSDGLFFTQEQIKEIINYADERGIRVVPEFDVPGHATAILTAYPELASAPGPYKIERNWGVFDPTLNPTIDTTYKFLDKLFGEMSQLFPDEYFHIGGDENNGNQWNANELIQKFMKENNIPDNHSLQGYFNNHLLKILTKYNKKMVGWDEIFHPSMPTNIVIQSWRGKEALVAAAKKGYQTILSNGYYIDLIQPTDYHYINDPLPKDIDLTETEKKLILGGETTMWAEMISPETIDSRIWPRTAAIAERFWSPQEINNVDNMYKRLDVINFELEEVGLTHLKNFDMMLRRLTNNLDVEPLKTLISVIEPVKIYKRPELKYQNQQSPLTRVVDAAIADAASARNFRNLVDNYLASDKQKSIDLQSKILQCLKVWKDNNDKLLPIIVKSPILFEIKPMSENLKKVAEFGEQILAIKEGKQEISAVWISETAEILNKAKDPVAQTELMIVSAIEKLLNSISR
jgi:hexosaminidase